MLWLPVSRNSPKTTLDKMKLFACQLPLSFVALAATCSGLLMPEPCGPYKISMQTSELVDTNRVDPWNSSHPRRIMVSRFDPVPEKECTKMCTVPYMSKTVARAEDAIYQAFIEGTGLTWYSGVLEKLELRICCEQAHKPHHSKKKLPVVLLSAGLNTTRLYYSSTAQYLASRGYTVITLDHPYETDIVEFPDGTTIYGGNVVGDLNNTAPLVFALDVRSNDATFVLNTLDIPFVTETDNPKDARVGMAGHSFGGAAAAAAMVNDTRIVGGVNLDGYMFGPVLNAGVGRPGIPQSFLLFGSVGHNSSSDPSWGQFLETMHKWHPEEWLKELSMDGSNHGSFGDYGIIADVAGWRNDTDLVDALFGEILGSRAMEITTAYLDDFLQMALFDKDPGLLEGPSDQFPEVQFLN